MTVRSKFVWGSLVLSVVGACSGRPAARDTRTVPAPIGPVSGHATAATPPESAHAAASSAAAHASPAAATAAKTATGTVLETMNASSYTYVRVKTHAGELWAAASLFNVAVGDRVAIALDQPMENFHSQSLNRDFPLIYFVSQIARDGGAPASAAQNGGAIPSATVDQPRGGTSIASLWKTRSTLSGKTVTVRGRVVKFNGGILGVNWIHLQDGTGSADDGSNDITVTSGMDARVGDVITATGVVALNKDLGSGYNYPIIIERATLQP
jgi:hypothetical protein